MARIRAARDHEGGTLGSCARGWDDNVMDSHQNFRSYPFHKMQSGAASMIRQSGNILDIAHAICTRSSHILGFVIQHRVHSLMNGLCRTASSCKAGLTVGALRVDCNGLCAATRSQTADENPGYLLGCGEGQNCLRPLHSHCLAWHYEQWLHLKYARRTRKRDASPADSKSNK